MLLGLLFNLVRLVFAPITLIRRFLLRRRGIWLHLRLDRRIVEIAQAETRLRRWLNWTAPKPLSLTQLAAVGEHLRTDTSVYGVVLEIPSALRAGWPTLLGLRQQISSWRAAGKHIVAYLPDGGTAREIYVALAANTIWIAPEATLSFLGIASESMYLKPLLDRLGIRVEVHAAGRFKTAAEPLVADHMSDAQREQRLALMETVHAELVAALIASGRIDAAGIEQALSDGLLRGAAAVSAGLVDDVCYPDQVGDRLAKLAGAPGAAPRKARTLPFDRYAGAFGEPIWRPLLPAPYIAVIAVHGAIGLTAPRQGGGANVPALTRALDAVRRDKRALAAVLHIDSPGGSALAGDHIHREVARLAEAKPVVACFGEVAASGGYYVAAPAQRIVAQATTVTGSIGVISAKIVLSQLLERIGVRPQLLKTAPHADMFSATRTLDIDEHAILEREMQGTYRTFLGVVAAGRKRPVEQIEALAAGRVWSGRDALDHGLVDRLGGFDVALDEARALLTALPESAQRRLKPRLMQSFATTRMLPAATEPEAWIASWLARISPGASVLWTAHLRGERLLMLHLD